MAWTQRIDFFWDDGRVKNVRQWFGRVHVLLNLPRTEYGYLRLWWRRKYTHTLGGHFAWAGRDACRRVLCSPPKTRLCGTPRVSGVSTIRTATTASHRLELYSEPHGMLRGISDGNTTVEVPSWLTVRFYLWTRRTR